MLIETQVPQIPPIADHGALTGLGGDDHTQYLRVDGSRIATELTIGASAEIYIYASGGDVHFYTDLGDIYLDPTSSVHITGDLDVGGDIDLTGTQITMAYGGLRIRSGVTGYDAEYDNYDNSNHVFQYQGNDLFAVRSDGIYIYNAIDSAYLSLVGNDLEIWGGTGDIVIYPYDFTVVYYLLAPDGIEFDIYDTEKINSSSGDMFYYAYYGHTFYGDNPLRSMGGFMSSGGSPGVDETVPTADGDLYFEDGLLVYYSVF